MLLTTTFINVSISKKTTSVKASAGQVNAIPKNDSPISGAVPYNFYLSSIHEGL